MDERCQDYCFRNGNIVIGSNSKLKFNKCSGLDLPPVKQNAKYDIVLEEVKVCPTKCDHSKDDCSKPISIYVPRRQKVVDIGWIGIKEFGTRVNINDYFVYPIWPFSKGIFCNLPECFKHTLIEGTSYQGIEYTEYHPTRINITIVLFFSNITPMISEFTLLTYRVDNNGNVSLVHEGLEAEAGQGIETSLFWHEISHTFPMDISSFDKFYFLLYSSISRRPILLNNILTLGDTIAVKSKIVIWS